MPHVLPRRLSVAQRLERVSDALSGSYGIDPTRMIVPARLGDVDGLLAVAEGAHDGEEQLEAAEIQAVGRGRVIGRQREAVSVNG